MKAPAVPAEKLKYLALVFAIATIGITAALIIVTLIDGLFNLGYITTCIAPVLLNVFIIKTSTVLKNFPAPGRAATTRLKIFK